MSDEYYQPESVEKEQHRQRRGGRPQSFKVHRLRPTGQEPNAVANHLICLLYDPRRFVMFRGVIVDPKVKTWFLQLSYHYLKVQGENGEYTQSILCKKANNKYIEKNYGRPVIYTPVKCTCGEVGHFLYCVKCGGSLGQRLRDDACPSCDKSDVFWKQWAAEWSRLLVSIGMPADPKGRYKLQENHLAQYEEMTKSGTALRHYQDNASDWGAAERFLYMVWDIDKFTGARPLAENEPRETSVLMSVQGPRIQKALWSKHENGKKFWSLDSSIQIVITRDTSKGIMRCTYDIDDAPLPAAVVTVEALAYLRNPDSIPDPSDEMIVLSYEEHANKVGSQMTVEEVSLPDAAASALPAGPLAPALAPTAPHAGLGRGVAPPPSVGGPSVAAVTAGVQPPPVAPPPPVPVALLPSGGVGQGQGQAPAPVAPVGVTPPAPAPSTGRRQSW